MWRVRTLLAGGALRRMCPSFVTLLYVTRTPGFSVVCALLCGLLFGS